jgi:hypothetical protein
MYNILIQVWCNLFFIFLSMPPVDITSVDMSAEQMAM